MKNNCNVAKDLMPLCIDGVASEESQQYVDEHIAECTECAVAYGAMKVELPRANQEKERAEMEMVAKKLRQKRIVRGLLGTVLGIVICIACYVFAPKLVALYDEKQMLEKYVCSNGDLKLDALYYDVSQGENQNSRVQVDIFSFPSGNPEFRIETNAVPVNDDTAFCVQYRAIYAPNDETAGSGVYHWIGTIKEGQWTTWSVDVRDEDGKPKDLPIVRLELHAGDDFVVLWEEGDVLQTPSEAKIKREAEEAKYKK